MKTIQQLLELEPIKLKLEKNALCITAQLSKTDFIENYKGCGEGIAYILLEESEVYLCAFNYGSKILLENYDYAYVEFSCTEVCFTRGFEQSINKQKKIEILKKELISNTEEIEINKKKYKTINSSNIPKELSDFIGNGHFGFVQQNIKRRHNGEYEYTPGSNDAIAAFPKEGAFEAYIYNLTNTNFTFGYGRENYNVIEIKVIHLFIKENDISTDYIVLIDANKDDILSRLKIRFDELPFEQINDTIKARYIYKYSAKNE